MDKPEGLRHTFYRTTVVLLTVLLGYFIYRLGQTLLVLFVAIIFASAMRPAVEWLAARGLHRGLAALLIYVSLIAGLVALLVVSIPPLAMLTMRLLSEGTLLAQVRSLVMDVFVFAWQEFNVTLPIIDLPDQLIALMAEADQTVSAQALPIARNTLGTLSQIVLALVMGFYWLTARASILELLLNISPRPIRTQVELVWNDIERTLGAYVRGQFVLMLVVGVASFVGLSLLRIPHAGALAVLAGLTEIIPVVGPFLGLAPALLVGLTVSPTAALLVVLLYFIIQQLESNILVPKVMEKNVNISPLLVILALVAGSQLGGFVGALLAVPVAGALQVIARHLFIEPAIRSATPTRMEGGAVLIDTTGLLPPSEPEAVPPPATK